MFSIFVPHRFHKTIVVQGTILTTVAIISMTIFTSLIDRLLSFNKAFNFLKAACYFFVVIVRTFFSAQFVFATFLVQKRFEALNFHLTSFAEASNFLSHKSFRASKFSILHHELCNGIDAISHTFTFQLIFVFGITMVRKLSKLPG